jgi:hypothetical protein
MDDERCNMDDISLKNCIWNKNLYDKNNHMCWGCLFMWSLHTYILCLWGRLLHRYLPMLCM